MIYVFQNDEVWYIRHSSTFGPAIPLAFLRAGVWEVRAIFILIDHKYMVHYLTLAGKVCFILFGVIGNYPNVDNA